MSKSEFWRKVTVLVVCFLIETAMNVSGIAISVQIGFGFIVAAATVLSYWRQVIEEK